MILIVKLIFLSLVVLLGQGKSLAVELNYGIYSAIESSSNPIFSHLNTQPIESDEVSVAGFDLDIDSTWSEGSLLIDAQSRKSLHSNNEQLNDTTNQLLLKIKQGFRNDKLVFFINDDLRVIKEDFAEASSVSNEQEVERLVYGVETRLKLNSRNQLEVSASESSFEFQNDPQSNSNGTTVNLEYRYIASQSLSLELARSESLTEFNELVLAESDREYINKYLTINYNDNITNVLASAGVTELFYRGVKQPDTSNARLQFSRNINTKVSSSVSFWRQLVDNSAIILDNNVPVSRQGVSVEDRVDLNIEYRNINSLIFFIRKVEVEEVDSDLNGELLTAGVAYDMVIGYSRIRFDYRLEDTEVFQSNNLQSELHDQVYKVEFQSRFRRNLVASVYLESRNSEERILNSDITDNRFGIRLSYTVGQ